MVKAEYYRRQADLCLQLALTQRDHSAALWLIELAEEMLAKAEAADPAMCDAIIRRLGAERTAGL